MKNLFLSGWVVSLWLATIFVAACLTGQPIIAQTAPAKPAQIAPVPPAGKLVDVTVPTVQVQRPESKPAPETQLPALAAPGADGAVGIGGAANGGVAIGKDAVEPDPSSPPLPVKKVKSLGAPYIIGPEDVLMIKVWGEANLSGQVTVGPDGMISLQLIDEVKADGLTPEQLKGVLTEKLKKFIKTPDVNVQVLRVNSRKFIILGEVSRPGSFSLTGPTTVMEALVSGGGFREFANPKKIYILRTELNPQTKKPETIKIKFNYKDVSHGKNMEQNILIQNGDQIFVP